MVVYRERWTAVKGSMDGGKAGSTRGEAGSGDEVRAKQQQRAPSASEGQHLPREAAAPAAAAEPASGDALRQNDAPAPGPRRRRADGARETLNAPGHTAASPPAAHVSARRTAGR